MSDSIFIVGAALLGLIIGSFLNALSFRFNTGRSIVHGRSKCMHCGHTLSSLDLIPLLSYLLLRGRCRYCSTKISIQYPLVEITAALLSVGAYINTPDIPHYAFWFFVWMVILFIVIYDFRHTIIPWSASYILMALALCSIFISFPPTTESFLAGPVLAMPFLLLSFFSQGTWMGWGDGVFEISLGWLLGVTGGLTALMLAVWSGACVGIVLVLFSKYAWKYTRFGFTMKSELPFAPFLALGAAAVYFFHVDFFSTLSTLW